MSWLCLCWRSWFVLSSAPADPPLTAYSAAMALPDVVPSMYAIMSVTVPVVVAVKYETDWALASFWSE